MALISMQGDKPCGHLSYFSFITVDVVFKKSNRILKFQLLQLG
jgi:hypothetical protein